MGEGLEGAGRGLVAIGVALKMGGGSWERTQMQGHCTTKY